MSDIVPSAAKAPRGEKTPIFRLLAAIALPFMHLVGKYRLHGVENVPTSGAFVLSPNHFSNIDPLVIGIAVWKAGRAPRFLAKASLFRVPIIGGLLRASGQVPVERAGVTSASGNPMAAARIIAQNGLAVVIYPEGTLTRDPNMWPMRGKSGAVRTALEQDIPLIPAAHWGTQAIMPRYGKSIRIFPLRKPVDVVFGAPLDLSRWEGRGGDSAAVAEATEHLMNAITALVEDLRGEKAPAERWDPAKNGQTETGRF